MMAAAAATSRVGYLRVQRSDPNEIADLWSNAVTWPARSPLCTPGKSGPDVTRRLRAIWDLQSPTAAAANAFDVRQIASPRHSQTLRIQGLQGAFCAPSRDKLSPSATPNNKLETRDSYKEAHQFTTFESETGKLGIGGDDQREISPIKVEWADRDSVSKLESLTEETGKRTQDHANASLGRTASVSSPCSSSDTGGRKGVTEVSLEQEGLFGTKGIADVPVGGAAPSWIRAEDTATVSELSFVAPAHGGALDEYTDDDEDSRAKEGAHKLPSSQYRGVVPQPNGRWGAQIYEKHQRVWLGTFNREEDAARAYDRAAMKFRGRDAMTNLRPVQEPDPEAVFLRQYSKEQIVEMLRRHTYEDEFEQSKRLASIPCTSHGAPRFMVPIPDSLLENDKARSMLPRQSLQREHLFEKAVTPSDVGKLNRLVIPKQHAERCFPLDLTLNAPCQTLSFEDVSGKHWRFRYSYWNSSQSYVFTKGWSRFVKEKKLGAGDTVSFERGATQELYITFRRRPRDQVAKMLVGPSASSMSELRNNLSGACLSRFGMPGTVPPPWHHQLNLPNRSSLGTSLNSRPPQAFHTIGTTVPQHLSLQPLSNFRKQLQQQQWQMESIPWTPTNPCQQSLLGSPVHPRSEADVSSSLEIGRRAKGGAMDRAAAFHAPSFVEMAVAKPIDSSNIEATTGTNTVASGTRLFGVELEEKSAQLSESSSGSISGSVLSIWPSQISSNEQNPYFEQFQFSFTTQALPLGPRNHAAEAVEHDVGRPLLTFPGGSWQSIQVSNRQDQSSFLELATLSRSGEQVPLSPSLRLATAGTTIAAAPSWASTPEHTDSTGQARDTRAMSLSSSGQLGRKSRKRKGGIQCSLKTTAGADLCGENGAPDTSLSLAQCSTSTGAATLSLPSNSPHLLSSIAHASRRNKSIASQDRKQKSRKRNYSPMKLAGSGERLQMRQAEGEMIPHVKCYMQWLPGKCLSTDLSKFNSTEALKQALLQFTQNEYTQGLDIVYKDKNGDVVLLGEQSWESFKSKVGEMMIRR